MTGARRRQPYIKNQQVALGCGVVFIVAAAFCFRDAYERRGADRPAVVSWLGV